MADIHDRVRISNRQERNPKNQVSNLFKKLTRLFSGPIVQYRYQTARTLNKKQMDRYASTFYSTSGQLYKKTQFNPFENLSLTRMVSHQRALRYSEFSFMEFNPDLACISKDTKIFTLTGIYTMEELVQKYSNGEYFDVLSWDKDDECYAIGKAHHPRKTGKKELVRVWLSNGKYLDCTKDHRIMLVDGTYKEAQYLNRGESLKPFNVKYNKWKGYFRIQPYGQSKYKWLHQYIVENLLKVDIKGTNIHHKNHNKIDNRIENLEVLSPLEHLNVHHKSWETHSRISESSKKRWKNVSEEEKKKKLSHFVEWRESEEGKLFMSEHGSYMIKKRLGAGTEEDIKNMVSGLKKWRESEEGHKKMSQHTSLLNRERWENDQDYRIKMSIAASKHANEMWSNSEWKEWKRKKHSEVIKLKFINDPLYREKIKHLGSTNGRFYRDIDNSEILTDGMKYNGIYEFARSFDFHGRSYIDDEKKVQFLRRRLRRLGYKSWKDYKYNFVYQNHKVVKVEDLGIEEDVYDLTVDIYENFCLECGIVISNSALDIYSEEMTTSSPLEPILKIKCSNEEIRELLHTLYYSILNAEFNLYGWCRNLCKYGDFFMYLDIDEDTGIKNAIGLPTEEIERLEGEDKDNPNYVQYQWNTRGITFENWQIAHFRILGNDKFIPYGSSILDPARRIFRQLCCIGSTKVWTESGFKKIKNIEVGDKVYSYDYNNNKLLLTTVKNKVCLGKDKVFEVKTPHRKLYLTKDHPIMMDDGNYKTVENLKEKEDFILLPWISNQKRFIPDMDVEQELKVMAILNEEGKKIAKEKADIRKQLLKNLIGDINQQNYGNKYNSFFDDRCGSLPFGEAVKVCELLNIPLSCIQKRLPYSSIDSFVDVRKIIDRFGDFIRFLGFLYGDGWIDWNVYTVSFSLKVDKEKISRYVEFIDYLGLSYGIRNSIKGNDLTAQCNVFSKHFCHILDKIGFITGGQKKRLPDWVYQCSNEDRIQFIEGFVDADGCVVDEDEGYYSVSNSNKVLIDQLLVLFQQTGYVTTNLTRYLSSEKEFRGKKYICNDYYNFKFSKRLNQYIKRHSDSVFKEHIHRIKQVEDEDVYDIEVDHNVHNFLAEGIVVSNCLIEDAMLAYRIVRSPERRVFYIDVGNVPPQDVATHMQRVITEMKSTSIVDADSGQVDLRYNPLSIENDYFIPVRAGSATKIETLPGGTYTGDIEDVKYLRDKLFSAIKIPMSYLSRGEGASEDKQSLCLSLNTEIPLLDGRILKLKEIIQEFNNDNKEMYIFSIDTDKKNIIPGKIKWAGITQKNVKKLLRLWFDNGKYLDCTENHEIIMRDGSKKHAGLLKENDSVMPLYRKSGIRGYQEVMHPYDGKYEFIHKMVAVNEGIYKQGKVIHHIDADKFNNNPSNLDCSMTWMEHRRFHQKHIEQTLMRSDVIERRKRDCEDINSTWRQQMRSQDKVLKSQLMKRETTTPGCGLYNWIHSEEHKKSMSSIMKQNWLNENYRRLKTEQNRKNWLDENYRKKSSGINHWSFKHKQQYNFEWLVKYCKDNNIIELRQIIKDSPIGIRWLQRILNGRDITRWRDFRKQCLVSNHKIIKIEELETNEDVGCLTIDNEFHNFAIESGVFVGNSQKDLRFARTIQRLQKSVTSELEKIGIIHLYILGFRGEDLISFKLSLNNPSKITELQELEHWRTKFDVANAASEGYFSRRWIAEKFFNISDEEYLRNQREIFYDRMMDSQWEGISGGEVGGEGMPAGGGGEFGGEELAPVEGEEEEESVLLAKPKEEEEVKAFAAGREEAMQEDKEAYTTPGAKGKMYTPAMFDKRNMGARKRSMQGKYSHEMGTNARRNLFKGVSDIMQLKESINFGIKKNVEDDEEKKILKENYDIKRLIESLESADERKNPVKKILE